MTTAWFAVSMSMDEKARIGSREDDVIGLCIGPRDILLCNGEINKTLRDKIVQKCSDTCARLCGFRRWRRMPKLCIHQTCTNQFHLITQINYTKLAPINCTSILHQYFALVFCTSIYTQTCTSNYTSM